MSEGVAGCRPPSAGQNNLKQMPPDLPAFGAGDESARSDQTCACPGPKRRWFQCRDVCPAEPR